MNGRQVFTQEQKEELSRKLQKGIIDRGMGYRKFKGTPTLGYYAKENCKFCYGKGIVDSYESRYLIRWKTSYYCLCVIMQKNEESPAIRDDNLPWWLDSTKEKGVA